MILPSMTWKEKITRDRNFDSPRKRDFYMFFYKTF